MTTSPLVDEAMQLGATPVAAEMLETQRWAMPPDLAYCFVEYSGVNLDLKAIMQRHSNIIAAMRKVDEANALPSHLFPPYAQAAPQQPPAAAQRPPAPNVAPRAAQTGDSRLGHSWGLCPDCNQPSTPSIAAYQQYEEDDEGNEVPAKHFCGNKQCQTKSLWRRQLVVEEASF